MLFNLKPMVSLIALLIQPADAQVIRKGRGLEKKMAPVEAWTQTEGHPTSGTFEEKDGSIVFRNFEYDMGAPALTIYFANDMLKDSWNMKGQNDPSTTEALKTFTEDKTGVQFLLKNEAKTDGKKLWYAGSADENKNENTSVEEPLKISLDRFQFLSSQTMAEREKEQLYLVLWCDKANVLFATAKVSSEWTPMEGMKNMEGMKDMENMEDAGCTETEMARAWLKLVVRVFADVALMDKTCVYSPKKKGDKCAFDCGGNGRGRLVCDGNVNVFADATCKEIQDTCHRVLQGKTKSGIDYNKLPSKAYNRNPPEIVKGACIGFPDIDVEVTCQSDGRYITTSDCYNATMGKKADDARKEN